MSFSLEHSWLVVIGVPMHCRDEGEEQGVSGR